MSVEEKIKQKAQLPKTGRSRELHREGHFVITLDSQGKIELTRYHPTSECHILVNPWLGEVLKILKEQQQKLEELEDEMLNIKRELED